MLPTRPLVDTSTAIKSTSLTRPTWSSLRNDFMSELHLLVTTPKYSKILSSLPSAFGFRAASESSTVASSRIDRASWGTWCRPCLLRHRWRCAIRLKLNSSSEQLGVFRDGPKKLNTYTPPRKLATAAAFSAFALFQPHLTYTLVSYYSRIRALRPSFINHSFVVGALLPARQLTFGRTGS
jgi:hypothetical protein